MSERYFLDTNIAVYCLDGSDARKQELAKDLMAQGLSSGLGVVSYQVLQEFCNVAANAKRLSYDSARISAFCERLLEPMNRVSPSTALLAAALQIREATRYAFYDSLILASAQAADCTTLYSEDMQHGQQIGALRIVNPFLQT